MEKLTSKITIIDFVFFTLLAMFFTVPEHPVLSLVANAVAAVFCLLVLMDTREHFTIHAITILYAVFAFLCFVSYFYSIHPEMSIIRIKSIPLLLGLFCAGLNYFSQKDNLQKFMAMYIGASLVSCVYLCFTENIFSGEVIGFSVNNTNIQGTRYAFAVVFMIYFLLQERKWWKLLITAVLVMFLLLTASRSSLFIMLISSTLLIIVTFRQKRKTIIAALIVTGLLISVFIYLIFHVELLYNIIGVRLEDFLSLVRTGEGDSSAEKRVALIRYGWRLFPEHPIFGQGLNTFSSVTKQALGFSAYSHNNYLELLVGVGLIGTLSYYMLPLMLLGSSWKLMRTNQEAAALSALAVSLLIGMFVSDFFTVNYYSKTMILIYMFVGSFCIKYTRQELL